MINMEIKIIKLIGLMSSIIKSLVNVIIDRTKIDITGKEILYQDNDALYIKRDHENKGLLIFGISTKIKKPVDVVRVEIEFAAPLQLLDPDDRGFFHLEHSLNKDYPFRVISENRFTTNSSISYLFALNAIFPEEIDKQKIIFSVYAQRRHSSFFGYLSFGKTQTTRISKDIHLTSEFVKGIKVLPNCVVTTIQPFLAERGFSGAGKEVSAIVHESFKDGTVTTKIIKGN
jgi:hypothetical protein